MMTYIQVLFVIFYQIIVHYIIKWFFQINSSILNLRIDSKFEK